MRIFRRYTVKSFLWLCTGQWSYNLTVALPAELMVHISNLRAGPNARPEGCFLLREAGIYLFSQAVSSQLSSAQVSLTSVFGMGTGGSSPSSTPAIAWPLSAMLLFSEVYTLKTEYRTAGKWSTLRKWGQALDLLVHASWTDHSAYTVCLSTL